ncbi:elongation factor P--(R)-beta-lysine ligase [Pseudidiomarina insulisalsae]|uniref:Elongation factor P lysine(34) lysyltransferase n=1 Tax=Pseudidiomarina insulisalsae TaxID=575789 RepID=A0A432YQZ9_9GAMM|nr:elongation factor P--(R)-beta-lysine ligase [Pseudidiomarina insulisalsae]RUO63780.1 elongation factor P lysine(34) lysyltransferase [Pseudidiomarina insulisalsae]
MQRDSAWQPSADLATLRARAALLAKVREFFAARQVLEVDTPLLAQYGVTDPHLENLTVRLSPQGPLYYLQTSPEYAMKRLLAAGSGSIYQLGKVFRSDEQSRRHNPEFTMLEWYREGFSVADLLDEIDQLLQTTVDAKPLKQQRYQDLFVEKLGVDPLAVDAVAQLKRVLLTKPELADWATAEDDLDTLLDGTMAFLIEPTLPHDTPLAVTHYPASQAALAMLDPEQPEVALRFEVFYRGVELANGYQELTDAGEQARRFVQDNQRRAQLGKPGRDGDLRLLAALQHGLPNCAGVALGFDRLLMAWLAREHISQVLPFAIDRA